VARYRFRFHGELNGFLPPALRDREFEHSAGDTDTLKHVIESLGVPHTEVARTDVEGETVDVWPHQPPVPLDEARFVLDGHLGRLAAYLRMLGFDTTASPTMPFWRASAARSGACCSPATSGC
jgi:uncharacterized protein